MQKESSSATAQLRRSKSTKKYRRATRALAAGAVIAGGTYAYASPVRFDNPPSVGHFNWFGGSGSTWLDVTHPASVQPGDTGAETAAWQGGTSAGGEIGTSLQLQVGGYSNYFLTGVDAGTSIPSGTPWDRVGVIYYTGFGSELPDGQATYLGVRFALIPGGDLHYGWIGVVRGAGLSPEQLDAFAWGYETEADVPIAAGAPEPGTLAALALGAAAILSRRRRNVPE